MHMGHALAQRALDIKLQPQMLGAPLVGLGGAGDVAVAGPARPGRLVVGGDFGPGTEEGGDAGGGADAGYGAVEVGDGAVGGEDVGEEEGGYGALYGRSV